MTNDLSYGFRRNLFERERTYTLSDDGLNWSDSRGAGALPFSQMREIRVYSVMGNQVQSPSWRCFVHSVDGQKLALTSLHFAGLGDFEDRHPAMLAFSRELIARAARQNPAIVFTRGLPRAVWFLSLFYFAVVAGCTAFGAVVLALMIFEARISALSALLFAGGIVVFAGISYAIWRWLKRSWPRPFDPLKQDPFATSGGD